MATYEKNQLYMVPLAELQPDPTQPRKYMDPVALEELTASVSQMGIIQPVVCRQDQATGLVYTVAGERRCAAARKAGLATVPAVFIDGASRINWRQSSANPSLPSRSPSPSTGSPRRSGTSAARTPPFRRTFSS